MEYKIYYDLETLKNALEIIKKAIKRYPKMSDDSLIDIYEVLLEWLNVNEIYELANCVIHKEINFSEMDFDIPLEIILDFFMGIWKRSEKLGKHFPILKQYIKASSKGTFSGNTSTI